ncbi:unnamed protein product [Rhizopus stolonifer]
MSVKGQKRTLQYYAYEDDEEVDELTEEYQDAQSVDDKHKDTKSVLSVENKLSIRFSRPRNSIDAAMLLVNFQHAQHTEYKQEVQEPKVNKNDCQSMMKFQSPVVHRPTYYPLPPMMHSFPPMPYYYVLPPFCYPYPHLPPPRPATFEPDVKKHTTKKPKGEIMDVDPESDTRKQNPRFIGDQYTPEWVRYCKQSKEGLCDTCVPGKWLQLKNSTYWYHKQFHHGISAVSGKLFVQPLETRWRDDENVEGLCHQCLRWIHVRSSKKDNSSLWYKHAHKCHVYDRPREIIPRKR